MLLDVGKFQSTGSKDTIEKVHPSSAASLPSMLMTIGAGFSGVRVGRSNPPGDLVVTMPTNVDADGNVFESKHSAHSEGAELAIAVSHD